MKTQDNNEIFAMVLEQVNAGDVSEAPAQPIASREIGDWSVEHSEGKLAVDVAHDDTHIFILSTIAGAVPDKIEVYVHNDLLTIRGLRHSPLDEEKEIEYFYTECFWGVFSRTIVLPTEVKGDLARAKYQSGILTVTIPKQKTDAKIEVEVVEE